MTEEAVIDREIDLEKNQVTSKTLVSLDFAIKYMLKDKGDYEIIQSFISAMLAKQGHEPVKIVELGEPETNKEALGFKKSIADLVVEDSHKRKYLVEIERAATHDFIHKAHFNISRLVVDRISEARDYTTIKKVYHITLLYFDLKDGNDECLYHGKTVVVGVKSKEKLKLEITDPDTGTVYDAVDVLPEHLYVVIPRFDDKIKDEGDEWLYLLKHSQLREGCQLPCARKLENRLNLLKMSEQQRNEYWRYNKEVKTAQRSIEFGMEEGRQKGIAEGIAKGIAEEAARGEAKLKSQKIETAKKMLSKGYEIEEIVELTGLGIEELKRLKSAK